MPSRLGLDLHIVGVGALDYEGDVLSRLRPHNGGGGDENIEVVWLHPVDLVEGSAWIPNKIGPPVPDSVDARL